MWLRRKGIIVWRKLVLLWGFVSIYAKWRLYSLNQNRISPTARRPQLVVSLTAIPPRVGNLPIVLESLFKQTLQPDRIVLWLSREYQRTELGSLSIETLPSRLARMQARGLEIKFRDDIGSHGKLVYALQEYPDDIIVTVDDDGFYRRDVLARLYRAYQQHGSDMVYCSSSSLIEQVDGEYRLTSQSDFSLAQFSSANNDKPLFVFGYAGTLYPPRVLHESVFDIPLMRQLAPHEDDTWFTAMRMLNRKRAFQVDTKELTPLPDFRNPYALQMMNVGNDNLARQLNQVMQHFQIELI